MTTTLRDEIKQTRPFASLEQEAHLSIERTAAILGHAVAEVLKPYGIGQLVPRPYRGLEKSTRLRVGCEDSAVAARHERTVRQPVQREQDVRRPWVLSHNASHAIANAARLRVR